MLGCCIYAEENPVVYWRSGRSYVFWHQQLNRQIDQAAWQKVPFILNFVSLLHCSLCFNQTGCNLSKPEWISLVVNTWKVDKYMKTAECYVVLHMYCRYDIIIWWVRIVTFLAVSSLSTHELETVVSVLVYSWHSLVSLVLKMSPKTKMKHEAKLKTEWIQNKPFALFVTSGNGNFFVPVCEELPPFEEISIF